MALLPPGSTTAVGRPTQNLDDPDLQITLLHSSYSVLYTVPPPPRDTGDPRLKRFLSCLDPVPRRVVYLSTSGVYGNRDGAETNEDVNPAPATARAGRRLAAETLLTSWCVERESDAVILRVPGIYGPGRLGLDRIEAAHPVLAEAEATPGNRIHVDDLAGCCVRALDVNAPTGIFNVGDGDHRSATWFAKTVARAAGLEPRPEVSRLEAERTFSETRLSFLRESRTLETRRMQQVLGFTPRYSNPEDGIRASLPRPSVEDGPLHEVD